MNEKAALAALPMLALVLAGLAGAPAGALAQQDQGLAAARACTTVSADAERLACYDRALRPGRTEGARVRRGESTLRVHPAPPAPAPPAAVAAPHESAPVPRESAAPDESAPALPAAAAAPRESTVERETRPRRAAPKASAGANDEFEITVVEVRRRSRLADAVFVTDDGRMWRQTDDKHILFPHPPFRAVISPGSFGSHFLTPPGQRVSVRVSEERR